MTFDELIAELDSGSVNSALSTEVRELTKALTDRAANDGTARGELVLKLRFAAANNGRVVITADTKVTRPGPPRALETRWCGPKGELLAQDPRQIGLPLRVPGMRHPDEPRHPRVVTNDETEKKDG